MMEFVRKGRRISSAATAVTTESVFEREFIR